MRAASTLSTNRGTSRWKQEVPEVAHALVRAVSALLPTPLDTGNPRCRHEQETVPSGTSLAPQTSASGSPLFPMICAEVCGKCRHGTHECVRHQHPSGSDY